MLIKLIKHDFISMFKRIFPIWLALGAVMIFQLFLGGFFHDGTPTIELIGSVAILLAVVVTVGFSATGFIMPAQWFSQKMYGPEGYLTNTLPCKTWHIILSKVIIGVIFTVIGGILAIVSGFFITWRLVGEADAFFRMFSGLDIHDWITGVFFKMAITLLIWTVSTLSTIYASVSIANAIGRGNKTLNTIIIFILIFFLTSFIGEALKIDGGSMVITKYNISMIAEAREINMRILVHWAYLCACTAVLFGLTIHTTSRYLKLKD